MPELTEAVAKVVDNLAERKFDEQTAADRQPREQPSARTQPFARRAQRPRGIGQVLEHVMHHDQVEFLRDRGEFDPPQRNAGLRDFLKQRLPGWRRG